MDPSKCMIVDLEKRGSRQMFVTERVSSISRSRNGLMAVQFAGSMRVFNYNPSRLLYLTDPETIDFGRKGLCINHCHSQPGNNGKIIVGDIISPSFMLCYLRSC